MTRPTTICRLTPPGRGAVATILVSGNIDPVDQYFLPRNGQPVRLQNLNSIRFGEWTSSDNPSEDVVLCRIAPNQVEIHLHGGEAATQRILNDLVRHGAELVSPWSLPLPHYPLHNHCGGVGLSKGVMPFTDADLSSFEIVTQATTERTALLVFEQVQRFPEAVKRFHASSPDEQQVLIAEMLRWTEFGEHLTKPWKLAICGRPNAGKSSLTNRLLGYERSIVFDQPGTTRDVLTSLTAIDGWPIEIIDTAGQRETTESLEAEGIERAKRAAQSADLTLLVLDATLGLTPEDQAIASQLHAPLIVWNKIDLVPDQNQPVDASSRLLPISAHSGQGIPELMSAIVHRLVPEIPPEGTVYPVSEQQRDWVKHLSPR